jgi:hypothetical protein
VLSWRACYLATGTSPARRVSDHDCIVIAVRLFRAALFAAEQRAWQVTGKRA